MQGNVYLEPVIRPVFHFSQIKLVEVFLLASTFTSQGVVRIGRRPAF